MTNEMELVFDAVSENESFARVVVAAFLSHLDPTLEELDDVKTAVSEAVTNAIIHGYENYDGYYGRTSGSQKTNPGKVHIHCSLEKKELHIEVSDAGKGIADLKQAMEPLYTSKPDLERSGMGFAFMEAFMDDLKVESSPGRGTTVRMVKKIGRDRQDENEVWE